MYYMYAGTCTGTGAPTTSEKLAIRSSPIARSPLIAMQPSKKRPRRGGCRAGSGRPSNNAKLIEWSKGCPKITSAFSRADTAGRSCTGGSLPCRQEGERDAEVAEGAIDLGEGIESAIKASYIMLEHVKFGIAPCESSVAKAARNATKDLLGAATGAQTLVQEAAEEAASSVA